MSLDGRWLVDGALVNPVPVSAARVFGARLVIAVNLSTDILGRSMIMAGDGSEPATAAGSARRERRGFRAMFGAEHAAQAPVRRRARRPGIPSVMIDAFNIMQDRITRARLAGDPPDVMINPRVGHVGWFDFHRAQEAIEVGARAAERALDEIGEAVAALAPRPAAGAAGREVELTLSSRLDVVAQRRLLVLHLLEPVLDHVADRHDAGEAALLDHRQMAEFAGRHPLHHRADGVATRCRS